MRSIFIFFLFPILLYSQKTNVALDELIDKSNGFLSSDLDSAMFYMKKAYVLNEKTGNDYYKARCMYNFGNINYRQGHLEKAVYFAQKALLFASRSGNKKILYRAENLLGLIEYDKTEYDKSVVHFQNALKYIGQTEFIDYYATIYFNLGNLTITKNDTINALHYYELARKSSLISKDTLTELMIYNSIGLLKIDKNRDTAEEYLEKALILSKKIDYYQGIFNIHINLSTLYNKSTRSEKSVYHLKQAELLINKIGDKNLNFYINFNYGGLYEKTDYKKAIEFYKNAEKQYKPGVVPIEQKVLLLKSMYEIYGKNNNPQKAYEYQTYYYKLKDSLFTLAKEKDYNRLFTKFEVEKKNNQILQLTKQKEIESLKVSKFFILALLLAITVIAVCTIFFQKLKSQRKIKEKEERINISKGILEGQTEERNRLAKELHDGVAGSLVGINLMLDYENSIQKNKKIIEIQNSINNLYEEVRDISHDLKSGMSENINLQQLIRNLAAGYERTSNFKSDILFFPADLFNDIHFNFKMDLYRIFQEIYTNVYKHSGARNVEINCMQDSEEISIIIEDNGKGFPKNYAEGIGLKNIKERLNKYHGEMEIENSGKGSVLILNLKMVK